MATQITATEELLDYVRRISGPEDTLLAELRTETAELPGGTAMQVLPEEARFLALLVLLTGAERILEIGTFTGYSTLSMARALPANGRLVTCDLNPKWVKFAKPYWTRAGVADRIEPRIGDAGTTLDELAAEDPFDLVFIDADKANYPKYYEKSADLLRPGGLIVLDNTLFLGRVIDPSATDPDTNGIREANHLIREDDRMDICVLPLSDGVTLARRKTF
ncbi:MULTISPECIES: O-methyltransferase [Amycolatopsis]|uniref:Class I SAM-dependent methyltransferase n=2 Tax=Amycolatopsis TaxID=1813 RepID=A0A7W3ZAL6_9PSEU|nr:MULTISPECIES: class I SAM-dependent methyltransferase [Amycolatopsis]MBB1153823.1 class I SAM-dependent methyltransferase [Amycolatopsis dendrobii]UKD51727.1 class I SAM-dependent methyltransferase [Amycolatopsis sp. FU40]